MSLGKFLFWSTVLSLPTLFFLPRRKPGVVDPGPEDASGVVLEPSDPPEPFPMDETVPAEFRTFPPPPAGYTRMADSDVPAVVMPLLRPLLAGSIGTTTKLPAPGRDIVAQIEPHYHPPGGATKPWGWHKGVTLYERKGGVLA